MNLLIKDQILVTNPKAIKILKKDITKRILKCFNEEPKTASQIANSISFPKDKIYYHIKNLISLDILFIAEKTMVKGKYEGVFGVGGLILARIPVETIEERSAYFNQRNADQMEAVDHDMMRENSHSSMTINKPDRQTRVTFGGPQK